MQASIEKSQETSCTLAQVPNQEINSQEGAATMQNQGK